MSRSDIRAEIDRIDAAIATIRAKHAEELKPFYESRKEAHLRLLKAQTGLDIGDMIKTRHGVGKIVCADYDYVTRWIVALQKKDGTIGNRHITLYSCDSVEKL